MRFRSVPRIVTVPCPVACSRGFSASSTAPESMLGVWPTIPATLRTPSLHSLSVCLCTLTSFNLGDCMNMTVDLTLISRQAQYKRQVGIQRAE